MDTDNKVMKEGLGGVSEAVGGREGQSGGRGQKKGNWGHLIVSTIKKLSKNKNKNKD